MKNKFASSLIQRFDTAAILATLLALSACGRGGSGPEVGRYSKPSPTAAKMQACAESKLGASRPIIGDQIWVCRRDESGVLGRQQITPGFYVSGKKKRIRLAQVIGVRLTYASATSAGPAPKADVKNQYDYLTTEFLKRTCAPRIEPVFKRSGLTGRIHFKTHQESDLLAGSTVASGGALGGLLGGDREDIFGEAGVQAAESALNSSDPKRRVGVDVSMPSANVILDLVVGADEGVSIKDHVKPLSSGPLKATGNDDQKALFCAQLLERIGENLGLGGLASDDKTCSEEALAEKEKARVAKPVPKKAVVGIMKAGSVSPTDLASLKLAPGELNGILSPLCGPLEATTEAVAAVEPRAAAEPLANDAETSQK